jgi:hypothetical protein
MILLRVKLRMVADIISSCTPEECHWEVGRNKEGVGGMG